MLNKAAAYKAQGWAIVTRSVWCDACDWSCNGWAISDEHCSAWLYWS